MTELSLDDAKAVYRAAIDSRARDAEGIYWWEEVRAELATVIDAPTVYAAAAVIAWWHHDWSQVADTPRSAAKRIRDAGVVLRRAAS